MPGLTGFVQDFNLEATKIISCGMDHSLKIWDMDKPEIKKAIEDSYTYDRSKMKYVHHSQSSWWPRGAVL